MRPATPSLRRALDRRLLSSTIAIAVWSCGGGSRGSGGKVATAPETAGPGLVVRETGVGPIDGNTEVSVERVQSLLPGYEVKGEPGFHLTAGAGPDVHVSMNGEKLLIILAAESGGALEVLVVSPSVASQARWRVGDQLTDPTQLAGCECLGIGLTCFTKGSHIGLVLDDNCARNLEDDAMAGGHTVSREYRRVESGEPAALATLNGRTVRMLMWKPRGFGSPRFETAAPPE